MTLALHSPRASLSLAFAVALAAGCSSPAPAPKASGPVAVQPGAPGQPTRDVPAGASKTTPPAGVPADVLFMQGMIHHHAQAIEMASLLKTRTRSEAMKQLGLRIDISQTDEIKMMKQWLTDRGAEVPMDHGHGAMMINGAMMAQMPGMLSDAEMSALAKASGTPFDRLFLDGMIRHHQGALRMVADLRQQAWAAQESTMFDFTTHVDADQRMEITRMQQLLEALK